MKEGTGKKQMVRKDGVLIHYYYITYIHLRGRNWQKPEEGEDGVIDIVVDKNWLTMDWTHYD